jgi:uncharacterized protein involved in exopolysaccharide biosynthesis
MINPAKFYTIDEYIEIVRNRIWYIIIPFVLIVVGCAGYAIFAPRLYKASTLILVSPQRIPEAFVQSTVTSKVEERLQSIAQEVLSRTRLEQIIGEMKLYQKEQKKRPMEEIVELMQKDIKIELPTTRREETKGFFTIGYIGRDPNVVATVANRLASQFIEENLKLREQLAVGTTQFLETEITASKEKLDELGKAVSNLEKKKDTTDAYNSQTDAYNSQKGTLTRNLEDLRAKYTENHPDVIIAQKKLADYKRYRIGELPEQRYSKAREPEMASLLREHQSIKETYERLLKKSQDAQQSENLEKRQKGEQFRIIDPARVPEKPFSPDISKILLIGLLAGIGGGLGLAFIREQMDRSFHDAGDVEITLGLNVLSTIPKIEEKES